MLQRKIIYTLLVGIALLYTSCNDVVKYNDGYDNQLTSYGPPSITKISTAANVEAAIIQGALTDMIVIQGDNLTGVKSIKISDVDVDLSTIYALRTKITLPIPRAISKTPDDLITVVTDKGTTTFPFTVVIPNLVVDGFYNEFAQAGDTVQVMGKYFDLYQLTVDEGTFTMSGSPITPLRTSSDTIVFIMPLGTPDGAAFTMSSSLVTTPDVIKFRESGISILDSNAVASPYLTDGTALGDPDPIDGMKFFRIHGSLDAWSWNQFFWTNFDLTDADVVSNPKDYYVKLEINTAPTAPMSDGRVLIGGGDARYEWNPAANGILSTSGKWHTVRLEVTDLFPDAAKGSYLVVGSNAFVQVYQPTTNVISDVSFTNYRIVKK